MSNRMSNKREESKERERIQITDLEKFYPYKGVAQTTKEQKKIEKQLKLKKKRKILKNQNFLQKNF